MGYQSLSWKLFDATYWANQPRFDNEEEEDSSDYDGDYADNDYFDGDHAKYDGDDVEVNAIFSILVRGTSNFSGRRYSAYSSKVSFPMYVFVLQESEKGQISYWSIQTCTRIMLSIDWLIDC